MNHKASKPFAVLTSAALASSLLFGAGTPALAEDELLKLTFPDVVSTHWAKSHIAKLASAGVVKGYTTGDFKPSQNVTQQEAIVMVVRMVGLEEEALAGTDDIVTGFKEDPFFTKYVVKALEERMINLGEETAAASTGDTPWGKRPATREWMAKLIVRALDEEPISGALTFDDASSVSSDAAGYVAKAAEIGLIEGIVENNKTLFKPKEAVTRAQIATILSRADQYIPDDASKYTSGYVEELTASTLTIQTVSGASATYELNAETLVFDAEGATLAMSDLTNRKPIRVIHKDGQAYYIEVSEGGAEATLESITGELTALDVAGGKVVLRLANGSLEPFDLAVSATVTDASGTGLSISQLTEGSEIRLERPSGSDEVTAVVLVEASYNDEGTAEAISVNTSARTVTFQDDNGETVTYPVADDAELTVSGEPAQSLSSLQVGDTFDYVIEDSTITSIDITAQKFVTISGEFKGIASDLITIMENGTTPTAYQLGKNPTVTIEGLANSKIEDIQSGDTVQLRISGTTNAVEQITVTNRNVSNLESVTLEEVGTDYVLVRDQDDKPFFYKYTNRTEFVLDGEALDDDDFKKYMTKGRTVTLNVSDDQLIRLDIVTKASGTVTSINTASKTITIKTGSGDTMSFPYLSSVDVEIPRESRSKLEDVAIGTKVHIDLRDDRIDTINVEKSFIFTLLDTRSTRSLSVSNETGGTETLSIPTAAEVRNKTGASITPAGLTKGEPIVVNYEGNKIVSVREAQTVLGKVSTLDVTGGKLSVTDYTNNVRNYDLSKGITVQEGDNISSSASALQLNDRVVIVSDAQGKPYVQVAEAQVRKFSTYSASSDEITVKRSSLGEENKFIVDDNAYVHTEEGERLNLSQLRDNDEITLYLLNGKIIELVR